MLTHCQTCNEPTDVKLDKATMKAYCTVCGNEVIVTRFHLQALKSNGEWMKPKGQSFMFQCDVCKGSRAGIIDASNKCVCAQCGSALKVTPIMLQVMVDRKNNKSVEPEGE